MFDVLMYLFESYIHAEREMWVDQKTLTRDLTSAGFHRDDIYRALNWLDKLADLQDSIRVPYLVGADRQALRSYTPSEMYRLDTQCRGLLLFLEQIQVLDPETREMVIDRAMELDTDEFELLDLKWVVLMVLFNVPGQEEAYQQMEALMFEADSGATLSCDS